MCASKNIYTSKEDLGGNFLMFDHRLLKPLSIVMCAEGTLLQNKKLLKSVCNVYISAIFAQYCEHGRNISNKSVIQISVYGVYICSILCYKEILSKDDCFSPVHPLYSVQMERKNRSEISTFRVQSSCGFEQFLSRNSTKRFEFKISAVIMYVCCISVFLPICRISEF